MKAARCVQHDTCASVYAARCTCDVHAQCSRGYGAIHGTKAYTPTDLSATSPATARTHQTASSGPQTKTP
eukprot:6212140-Pleurochrysis_carterae.AAC.2